MKICRRVILLLFFLLLFPPRALAIDVVLNEIFANPVNEDDEYIELFNTTSSEVTLSGWTVSDKVKTYTLSGNIPANGFFVINKSASALGLNNSDEEISLKDSLNNVVDTFSYADTIEGKSWSRYPDGSGSFVNNTNITSLAPNASAPTPTPTSTTTPTKAPTPTKTPTPTPTNKPNPTPTPTKYPTPTQTLTTTSKTLTNTPTAQRKSTPPPTKKIAISTASSNNKSQSSGEVKGEETEKEDKVEVKKQGLHFSHGHFLF